MDWDAYVAGRQYANLRDRWSKLRSMKPHRMNKDERRELTELDDLLSKIEGTHQGDSFHAGDDDMCRRMYIKVKR